MSSINTNLSAMTALQSLKSTQTAMNKNQNQISTGLRVSEASHNASYWSISTQMKSDNGALSAVKDSIQQSKAMINTFTSAMDKSLTYLNKMKAGLVAASQPGADMDKIQTEFKANIEGMKSAAGSATFNGQNWLAQEAPTNVKLVTSYDGKTNTVGTLDIDTSKTNLFKNATAGTGGILHDVAAIKIDGSVYDLDVGNAEDQGQLSISVGGVQAGTLALDATNSASVKALRDAINADSTLSAKVTASLTDDGKKLRLVSKDGGNVSASIAADTEQTAASASATSAVTLGIKESFLSAGDQIKMKVGTAEKTFTVGNQESVDDLVKSINSDKDFNGLVKASNSSGSLVLTTVDNNTAIEGTVVDFGAPAALADALKSIDEAITKVTEGSSMLGANKALLETQEEFIGVLKDSLTAGVSAFVDADMNEVSTRNQALQTQQQLGVQALSIANQNSQMILRLFQ